MSDNPYEKFFAKAHEAKRGAASTASAKQTVDRRLRKAMKIKRKKLPFPWKAVAGLSITLAVAGFYLVAPDSFEKLLSKVEIRAVGMAGAEEKAAEKSKSEAKEKEKPAAKTMAGAPVKGAEEKPAVSEDLNHFDKLKQRKEELDSREKELSELEEELQKQKVELDKRITQLEEMRSQIGQTLKDRVEVDQEKVNKLVDLYSNMKPKQAADIIGSLNEELAVEVMAKMKKKNAAEVMNLLPPEKARILSEKYTGYRRISSAEKDK